MNYPVIPYCIFPLGDAAITVDFGNCIDEMLNREVIARFAQLQQHPLPGMTEAVPAYSTITVYYDVPALKKKIPPHQTAFEWMRQQLEERLRQPFQPVQIPERLQKIPVCYEEEFAWDIQQLATAKNISVHEVIQIHSGRQYRVYMLGFMPGFTYMGEVDEKITMPRKPQPVKIAAGSVGIAGKQTGIYPFASPGGWQIIGRTPVQLFKAISTPVGGEASEGSGNSETFNNGPALLRAGDTVKFYPISKNDFYEIQNSPSLFMKRGLGDDV